MRVGTFSLRIPEGVERDSGHVEIAHNSIFSIHLGNHDSSRDSDAEVFVDGKTIGVFRVQAGRTMILETPPDDPGKGRFTSYQQDSQQAQDAGVNKIGADNRGLVQVVFRPEKRRPIVKTSSPVPTCYPQVQDELNPWRTPHPDIRPKPAYRGGACGQSMGGIGIEELTRGAVECCSMGPGSVETHSQNMASVTPAITGLSGQSAQSFHTVSNLDYEPNAEVTISLRLVASTRTVRELQPTGPKANAVPATV